MNDLLPAQIDDLYEIDALCKRLAIKIAPLTFDNRHVPLELRSRLKIMSDEAEHMRSYLKSREYVKEVER